MTCRVQNDRYTAAITNTSLFDMNMRPNPAAGFPGRTYRFHTGPQVFPAFHGLSYTTFTHAIQPVITSDDTDAAAGLSSKAINADLQNTGKSTSTLALFLMYWSSSLACDAWLHSDRLRVGNRPASVLCAADAECHCNRHQHWATCGINLCAGFHLRSRCVNQPFLLLCSMIVSVLLLFVSGS